MDTIVLPPMLHTVNYLKYTTFRTTWKMAKYEKSFTMAIHAQTSYRHGVNWIII